MNVNVSNLREYLFCPRSVYLSVVLGTEPDTSEEDLKSRLLHAVRKELSLRQSRVVSKAKCSDWLERMFLDELENILNDVPYIYRELLSGNPVEKYLPQVGNHVLIEIRIMADNLGLLVDDLGLDETLSRITPLKTDYTIRSDELGLSGRIDKVMSEEFVYPVDIRTGKAGAGVWKGDMVSVCAYSILLEEDLHLEKPVSYGFVEYVKIQEKRPVMNTEKLRREVLRIRDSFLTTCEGDIPDVLPMWEFRKCRSCRFREACAKA